MHNCPFCNLDNTNIVNTVIHESDTFLVLPSKGSLCDGYLLIVPKKHINSINELTENEKHELLHLINKYRDKFKSIYGKFPLLFEHGSSGQNADNSSSSIKHAHLHIVNHKFTNEIKIISELNLQKVDIQNFFEFNNKNYISYISNDNEFYITYEFKPISQQMRIYIAENLGITNDFNWRQNNFEENIISTIEKFKR